MKKLDKDEINRLLEKAPTGAQNVVEIAEGQFVVFSKMVDGTKEEFSFYSLVAENNTEWLSFKTKKHLGNGLWLLTDFNDNQRFYNTDTGVMSNLLCFKTKEDLGNGLWLLTDPDSDYGGDKYLYNVNTNARSPFFKTKKHLDNGLWLLTDFNDNQCFYNTDTGMMSNLLWFLWFKTKEDFGNGLWLLTSSEPSVHGDKYLYNVNTNARSPFFKTKEDFGNGLWLLTDSFSRKCFYNVKTNVTFVSKTKEDPSNGLWLLTDFDGHKCFYNVNTGKKSDTLSFEYYVVQNGEIVCISRYGTRATLNVETMELGPYQVREA